MKLTRRKLRHLIIEAIQSGNWESGIPMEITQIVHYQGPDGSTEKIPVSVDRNIVLGLLKSFYGMIGQGNIEAGRQKASGKSRDEFMTTGLEKFPTSFDLEYAGEDALTPEMMTMAKITDTFVGEGRRYYNDIETKLASQIPDFASRRISHYSFMDKLDTMMAPALADLEKALLFYGDYL